MMSARSLCEYSSGRLERLENGRFVAERFVLSSAREKRQNVVLLGIVCSEDLCGPFQSFVASRTVCCREGGNIRFLTQATGAIHQLEQNEQGSFGGVVYWKR